MSIIYAFYAARRYWNNEEQLQSYYEEISKNIIDDDSKKYLINDMNDIEKFNLKEQDILVAIPMSGAVQKEIIQTAKKAKYVIVYAAYIIGNVSEEASSLMVMKNAAPTVMDCWAALKRSHNHVRIALNKSELQMYIKVFSALQYVKNAKIILVGETEPWVVSNSDDIKDYEKLGVKIEKVPQEEVAEVYRSITNAEAEIYYNKYKSGASEIVEPTDEDIVNSARMAVALQKVMNTYNADGMALACFNLLKEGTSSCLGASYINDCTDKFVSCEGDLDSAVTMLLMKKLVNTKLWMANPGIHPEGIINFSHCTAPIDVENKGNCNYILRNHHESGIGTSIQVELPLNKVVTACRISDNAGKITINKGITIDGKYESACRTQLYIKFDDFKHYINTALGCHQVFAFEDVAEPMALLAEELGLEII
ncbi:MAG TPA: hypothetical protein DCS12_09170 [Clostridiales bacterium]|nr:hypothetical protein [Clostridiales bacterium]